MSTKPAMSTEVNARRKEKIQWCIFGHVTILSTFHRSASSKDSIPPSPNLHLNMMHGAKCKRRKRAAFECVTGEKKCVTDGKRCDQTPFSDQYAANPKGERKTSRKICSSLLEGISMLWWINLSSLTLFLVPMQMGFSDPISLAIYNLGALRPWPVSYACLSSHLFYLFSHQIHFLRLLPLHRWACSGPSWDQSSVHHSPGAFLRSGLSRRLAHSWWGF